MNDAIELLKREIEWHKGMPGTSRHTQPWEAGFLKGMEHCLNVLKEACVGYQDDTNLKGDD